MEGNTQSSSLWQDDDDQEFVDNAKLIAGIQPVQRCLDDISVAKVCIYMQQLCGFVILL